MELKCACEKAMEHFREYYNDTGLAYISDVGDRWVFAGTHPNAAVFYGKQDVSVNKETGELEIFYLPDIKNLDLLDNAKDVEIPEEYRV